jgi:putative ABC transport system permease protein
LCSFASGKITLLTGAADEYLGKNNGIDNMMRPRWRKILHDLFDNKLRTLLVVFSIAVGVFSIGVITGTYVIIKNDMSASYEANQPMNVEMRTGAFDSGLVDTIKNLRTVKTAEGRRVFNLRVRIPGSNQWTTLDLVAIQDYSQITVNLLHPIEGSSIPVSKQVLLEKKALENLNVPIGSELEFQLADGTLKRMTVAGVVQDQTTAAGDFLAPPLAFISMDTLPFLAQPETYNRLYVILAQYGSNPAYLNEMAASLKDKVEKNNIVVFRTRTSSSNRHPMASTVEAVLGILGALGVLILFLSSSLIANTLSALLNQHMRHIGIMKLVGGRQRQVFGMYIVLILAFGVIALFLAVPLGGQGAYALAAFIADKLNFTLTGYRIVPLALLIQVIIGLAVPLLVGLLPVLNGSRVSVQRALSNDLTQDEPTRREVTPRPETIVEKYRQRLMGWLARHGIHMPRPLLISLRNTFRRKGRLVLTLFTLTMGGAIFIAVFNVQYTLNQYIEQIGKYFIADVTLDFDTPYRLKEIELAGLRVDGVLEVEGWAYASAEVFDSNHAATGNLAILAPPVDSKLVSPILISGRWLQPGDEKAIAVSESILGLLPGLKPGDSIHLKINGKEADWVVVGIFQFVNQEGPIAYGTYEYISRLTHMANRSFSYRVVTADHSPANQLAMSEKLDAYYRSQGFHLREARTGLSTLKTASESLNILVVFLMIMALLTASVGSMGLAGSMSMNVLERTREIGIMRSIGAGNRAIMTMVIVEGMLIGSLSWLIGMLVSFPITFMLSRIISLAIFQSPIPLHFTFEGFGLWLLVVLVLSAIASLLPARNAARLTIREVLAYE